MIVNNIWKVYMSTMTCCTHCVNNHYVPKRHIFCQTLSLVSSILSTKIFYQCYSLWESSSSGWVFWLFATCTSLRCKSLVEPLGLMEPLLPCPLNLKRCKKYNHKRKSPTKSKDVQCLVATVQKWQVIQISESYHQMLVNTSHNLPRTKVVFWDLLG